MASPETRELRPVPGGRRAADLGRRPKRDVRGRQKGIASRAPARHRAARGVVVIASHEQEQPVPMTVFPIAGERAKKLFHGGAGTGCWPRMAKRRHLS